MPTISAFIITKNEEQNLRECLECLKWCDQIVVVVDDQTTDRTAAIAQEFTSDVFIEPWKGYAAQKNGALQKCNSHWALWTDADERVPEKLAREIRSIIEDSQSLRQGYRIPRKLYFLGKRLRFGGVGTDSPLRLFLREGTVFPETQLVHEYARVSGSVGRLRNPIHHHSYPTMASYWQRFDKYTSLAARQLRSQGQTFHWWHTLKPVGELLVRVFFRLAFLDGPRGILFAGLSSYYVWTKYRKLRTGKPFAGNSRH